MRLVEQAGHEEFLRGLLRLEGYEGDAYDDDGDNRDEVETEIVSMNLIQ